MCPMKGINHVINGNGVQTIQNGNLAFSGSIFFILAKIGYPVFSLYIYSLSSGGAYDSEVSS